MKRILLFSGIGLAVLLVVVAVVPFLVPNEVYKRQIEQAATQALGRDVTVEGAVNLSIFPQIAASVDGVTVANPEGFSRDNMVEAGALRGVVKWAPLLSRRVEVAEISFVDADVLLERRADGAVNWEFAAREPGEEPAGPDQPGTTVDAGIDRASLQNARLVYADALADARYEISQLDLTATLQSLDTPLEAEAAGLFQGTRFDVGLSLDAPQTLLDGAPAQAALSIDTEGGAVSYDGLATLAGSMTLDGRFSVDGRDLSQLASLAGVAMPVNLDALGRLRASGQVSGPVETARITFDSLSLGGGGLSGEYAGDVVLGEAIGLDGRLTATSGDLGAWLAGLGLELPPSASILEGLDIETRLAGTVDALRLSETELSHSGRLLDARFTGGARLGAASSLDGQLSASSDRLRELLAAAQVEIEDGDTLESFSLEGGLEGSLSRIAMTGIDARLDDIAATGTLTLLLDGARPSLAGALETGVLDLSPFLGEGNNTNSQDADAGWSDAPLDLSGLQAIDADLTLVAQRIILGDIELVEPDLSVALEAGDLTARIASMQAFGGRWRGTFGLGAGGEVPTMRLDLTGETIQLSDALTRLAGLDALSGVGAVNIDVSSRGASLKALVEGLAGDMGTDLAQGAIRGINVGQLVRSRDSLLQALADGSLQMALAPEAETDFTSLLAGLTLEGGVASLDRFQLVNPVLSLDGSGSIDLGARTLDIGIVPRVDTSGQATGSALQLNGVPIPFRIRGDWMSPGLTPDTQMIQSILRQDAEARARDAIREEVGDEVGGLLEGILGPRQPAESPADPAPAPPETASPDATPAPAEPVEPAQPRDPEDLVEELARDAARDALGGLFGNRSQDDGETQAGDEDEAPEAPQPDPQ